jgi:hypothetical protein
VFTPIREGFGDQQSIRPRALIVAGVTSLKISERYLNIIIMASYRMPYATIRVRVTILGNRHTSRA